MKTRWKEEKNGLKQKTGKKGADDRRKRWRSSGIDDFVGVLSMEIIEIQRRKKNIELTCTCTVRLETYF